MLWTFKYILIIYSISFGTIIKNKLGSKDV